jgi:hypothetical protein
VALEKETSFKDELDTTLRQVFVGEEYELRELGFDL